MSGDLLTTIGSYLERSGRTLAVAESLTGGMLCSRFAATPGSGGWFRGGIVAYATGVKQTVLGVRPGPVVTEAAAREMAAGAATLFRVDVAVALTGAGGPEGQDGQPPGTVWLAAHSAAGVVARLLHLGGEPEDVCRTSCDAAVQLLAEHLPVGASGR